MAHSEFYTFVTQFWWLIFPVFWLVVGSLRIVARHRQSERLLDMIQNYAAQGKEPPAAMLDLLQTRYRARRNRAGDASDHVRLWRHTLLFAALAMIFAGGAIWRVQNPDIPLPHAFGWIVATLVMAVFALNGLAALLASRRAPVPGQIPDKQ